MSDLCERLRSLVILDEVGSNNPLGREAADEIASLRAQLATSQELCTKFEAAVGEDVGEMLRLREQLASARKALEPFAAVAEHDIGADEVDADIFFPMREPYNRAPRLRVGHLRAAKAALTDDQRGG